DALRKGHPRATFFLDPGGGRRGIHPTTDRRGGRRRWVRRTPTGRVGDAHRDAGRTGGGAVLGGPAAVPGGDLLLRRHAGLNGRGEMGPMWDQLTDWAIRPTVATSAVAFALFAAALGPAERLWGNRSRSRPRRPGLGTDLPFWGF